MRNATRLETSDVILVVFVVELTLHIHVIPLGSQISEEGKKRAGCVNLLSVPRHGVAGEQYLKNPFRLRIMACEL